MRLSKLQLEATEKSDILSLLNGKYKPPQQEVTSSRNLTKKVHSSLELDRRIRIDQHQVEFILSMREQYADQFCSKCGNYLFTGVLSTMEYGRSA